MVWKIGIGFALAFLALFIGFIFFVIFSKKKIKYPVIVFIVLIFLGGASVFYPIYWEQFSGDKLVPIKAFILALHNSIRLFVLDGDFEIIFDSETYLDAINGNFRSFYHLITALYYIIAPILTAGFVLSSIKVISSYVKFKASRNKEVFIFSELNKKTINLAKSIRAAKKSAVIVFCNITEKAKEDNNDIYDDLLDLHPITLERDITALKIKHHSKDKDKGIHFFIISEDDEKNLIQYNTLFEEYIDMANGKIYLFSKSAQSDLTFNQLKEHKIQCRKYDGDYLIINNYLFEKGVEIFKSAKPINKKTKQISIVVVGLGANGKTLVKALAWFCQMDGYRLEVNVFDNDEKAISRFKAEAPELLNSAFANPSSPNENQFVINIHQGIEVGTFEFNEAIQEVAKRTTYAFCCLGDDERNIDCAIKLRMLFEKYGGNTDPVPHIPPIPHITAIVYSGKKEHILDAKNFKGQPYDIECIGSYETSYTFETIIESQLEKEAIAAHRRYSGNDQLDSLFAYVYNFRSNCATAIHYRARKELGINGADRDPSTLTEQEIDATNKLEHRRWAAWIRSEGYSCGPRNDLAKLHPDIRVFEELSEADILKDTNVAIKKDGADKK